MFLKSFSLKALIQQSYFSYFKMNKQIISVILISVFLFAGCTISQNVSSVKTGTSIDKVYVLDNEKVQMDEMVVEIVKEIRELGFDSASYQGETPEQAKHYIHYTANWNWDMAMYLTYFKATLYENGEVLGEVEYDARKGGSNMGKFGKTREKIKPLLEELFSNVERPSTISAMGSN